MGVELTRSRNRLDGAPAGRPAAGFTLIEVLIGAGILLIVSLGVLPLFSRAIQNNSSGNDSTQLSNLARTRLEEFYQMPFNSAELTLTAGTERQVVDYFWAKAQRWEPTPAPPDNSDGAVWARTTTIRQYNVTALNDGVLDPATEALPAGTAISNIHLKEIMVNVQGTRAAGPLGGSGAITLRILKAQ